MLLLDPLHRPQNHLRVAEIEPAITIEIVHASVAVRIDDDVCGITVLMSTRPRCTLRDVAVVVVRLTKSTQHAHAIRLHPMLGEIGKHELELVDQRLLQHDELRPDVALVMR